MIDRAHLILKILEEVMGELNFPKTWRGTGSDHRERCIDKVDILESLLKISSTIPSIEEAEKERIHLEYYSLVARSSKFSHMEPELEIYELVLMLKDIVMKKYKGTPTTEAGDTSTIIERYNTAKEKLEKNKIIGD